MEKISVEYWDGDKMIDSQTCTEKELHMMLHKARIAAAQALVQTPTYCAVYCVYEPRNGVYRFSTPPRILREGECNKAVQTANRSGSTVYLVKNSKCK